MAWIDIPILTTERLRLRPLTESDIDDYAALRGDPEVMRFLGDVEGPWDWARSWRHLAFLIGHWRLEGAGSWAVELRETGAFLGVIGYTGPGCGWPGFELAWVLGRRWWGNGYATEGARAALAHAFHVWNKDRVISLIREGNAASIRVAERLGESLQGRVDLMGREMLCYGIDGRPFCGAKGILKGRPLGDWRF